MKILVLGGTRFIGLAAVRRLHAQGHEVCVFNRGESRGVLPEGVARITGDLKELEAALPSFREFAPDVVLHCLVISEDDAKSFGSTFRGLAERTVMLSSMDVYQAFGRVNGTEDGEADPRRIDEDGPLRANWYPYRAQVNDPSHRLHDYDKIPAERAVLSDSELPGTVLRLPMVIGPGDYQHRLYGTVRPILDGRKAIVMDESVAAWRSTYGYVENVGAAIALACTDPRAAGRTYNVADATLSSRELAGKVAEAMGWSGDFVLAPSTELPEALRADDMNTAQDLDCAAERIRQELDFKAPVELDEAIRRTVAWERENPPEPLPEGLLSYEAEDAYLS